MELHKQIPELKKVQPATDQRMLPSILEKTAANVDQFFSHIVDLIALDQTGKTKWQAPGHNQ